MNSVGNIGHLVITLNDLATINRSRAETYRSACQRPGINGDLGSIFYEKSKQSEDFVHELEEEIRRLNSLSRTELLEADDASIAQRTNPQQADREESSVLDDCESVEQTSIQAYDEALHANLKMPAELREKMLEQQTAIKKSQEMIRRYGILNQRPNER